MTTTTLDKPEGIAALNASIQIIKDSIEEQDGGHFNVKVEVGGLLLHRVSGVSV